MDDPVLAYVRGLSPALDVTRSKILVHDPPAPTIGHPYLPTKDVARANSAWRRARRIMAPQGEVGYGEETAE